VNGKTTTHTCKHQMPLDSSSLKIRSASDFKKFAIFTDLECELFSLRVRGNVGSDHNLVRPQSLF